MPQPFLVVATQNPVESEGVYPLAEAQRDRFLMRVPVDYPSPTEERAIVARMADLPPQAARLLDPADVVGLQDAARRVAVDEPTVDYAIRLVLATRDPAAHGLPKLGGLLEYSASRVRRSGWSAPGPALLRGRERAVPQDVYDAAYGLNARLALSRRALAEGYDRRRPRRAAHDGSAPGETVRYVNLAGRAWHRSRGEPVPALSTSPGAPGATPPLVWPGDQPAAR
jgi:MoxR-like ATPase